MRDRPSPPRRCDCWTDEKTTDWRSPSRNLEKRPTRSHPTAVAVRRRRGTLDVRPSTRARNCSESPREPRDAHDRPTGAEICSTRRWRGTEVSSFASQRCPEISNTRRKEPENPRPSSLRPSICLRRASANAPRRGRTMSESRRQPSGKLGACNECSACGGRIGACCVVLVEAREESSGEGRRDVRENAQRGAPARTS